MQSTIEKSEAISHLASSLEGFARLRKAVIPVFVAKAVGLEIPAEKANNPRALVKYFVGDIFDACGVEVDSQKQIDTNFFESEEKRLLAAIANEKPGAKKNALKVELVELRDKFEKQGDETKTKDAPSE